MESSTLSMREQVLAAYPSLTCRAAIIDTLSDRRVFHSEWAKQQAVRWSADTAWQTVADEIDNVYHSPDESHRLFLASLLEYVEAPTVERLSDLLEYEPPQNWADLYPTLAYILLSDKECVPLVFALSPSFMGELLNDGQNHLKRRYRVMEVGGRRTRGKLIGITSKDVLWSVDMVSQSIRSLKAARWIVSVCKDSGYTHGDSRVVPEFTQNVYVAMVANDAGDNTRKIVETLIRFQDQDRLVKLVKGLTNEDLRNGDNRIDLLMECKICSVVRELLSHLVGIDKTLTRQQVQLRLWWFSFDVVTLRTLLDDSDEQIRSLFIPLDNRDDRSHLYINLTRHNDLEYLQLYERIGLSIGGNVQDAIITVRQQRDPPVSFLQHALQYGATNLFDYLIECYAPDPTTLLYEMMITMDHDKESPGVIDYLLNNYQYDQLTLYTAIARSNDPRKTQIIMKRLGLAFKE